MHITPNQQPHLLAGVFLPLILPGMWLWLWRGCPVCALSEQSLQRGPEPAEVQTLPGLWTHQPLPEGQLLHHEQRRVWRLPARVRGRILLVSFTKTYTLMASVSVNKHLILCLAQILQEDKTKRFPGHGVHTLWRPSTSL